MKKKVFSLVAALFVSVIAAYAFPVRITCENGSQHMAYAQDMEDVIELVDALCSM